MSVQDYRDYLEAAIDEAGIQKKELAKAQGWTGQQFSARLARGTIRADEYISMMDYLGIDITYTVRATGERLAPKKAGKGRRLRFMVDGVIYDTGTASAIADSFYSDGEHEYTDGKAVELYRDSQHRYFFAEYYDNVEGMNDRIIPVIRADAVAFAEKYAPGEPV